MIAWPYRTSSHALWPWAAGAVMAFSGWLPVQAMPTGPGMPVPPDWPELSMPDPPYPYPPSPEMPEEILVPADPGMPAGPNSPQCTISSATVTCSGDLSNGVEVGGIEGMIYSIYSSLIVNGLTSDIAPETGGRGITFANVNNSDIAITVDTGSFSINTDDIAIYASSIGLGDISIKMTGNISTNNDGSKGIYAFGGNTEVEVNGNINTSGDFSEAIYAGSRFIGNTNVKVNANLNTSGNYSPGIYAHSDAETMVMMTGDINTLGDLSQGIYARSTDGNTTVDVNGNISTFGVHSHGIHAISDKIFGNVSHGIDIPSYNGDVNVHKYDWKRIETEGENSDGVRAYSNTDAGDIFVGIYGRISTNGTLSRAIHASGNQDIAILAKGVFTTVGTDSDVIYATSDSGNINIKLSDSIIKAVNGNGIHFEGGSNIGINKLEIDPGIPTIISGSGIFQRDGETYTGIDIRGEDGNESILNRGILITPGIIDLGGGRNAFKNRTGATFVSGESVILGRGNEFANWGDFSPGGRRNVQKTILTGNFVSMNDSNFTVTLKPTAKGLKNDKLIINGMATLEGGKVRVKGVKYAYDDSYTILTASDGINGKFDGVIDTLFIDNRLSYVNDSVILSSTSKGTKASRFARTANQRSVASQGLDTLLASGQSNAVTQAVLNLTTTDQAEAAYDGLSGEVHASLKGALLGADQLKMAAINRRIHRQLSQPGAQPAATAFGNLSSFVDDQSGFWITGYRSESETDASFNTAEMDTDLDGILLGMERELAEHWRFGVLGGYGQTAVDQPERSSFASVDTWSLGLYGGADNSASSLSFGAIYSSDAVDTSRSIHIDDLSEHLSASYGAHGWQLFTEVAHQIEAGNVQLEPFAGLSSSHRNTNAFSESGGDAALTASSDISRTTFTTLGMRSAIALGDVIQARAMLGWRHGFGDANPSSALALQGAATSPVMGAAIAEAGLVTELGVEASLTERASLDVAYNGRYGDGTIDHGFNADLKLKF